MFNAETADVSKSMIIYFLINYDFMNWILRFKLFREYYP